MNGIHKEMLIRFLRIVSYVATALAGWLANAAI